MIVAVDESALTDDVGDEHDSNAFVCDAIDCATDGFGAFEPAHPAPGHGRFEHHPNQQCLQVWIFRARQDSTEGMFEFVIVQYVAGCECKCDVLQSANGAEKRVDPWFEGCRAQVICVDLCCAKTGLLNAQMFVQ